MSSALNPAQKYALSLLESARSILNDDFSVTLSDKIEKLLDDIHPNVFDDCMAILRDQTKKGEFVEEVAFIHKNIGMAISQPITSDHSEHFFFSVGVYAPNLVNTRITPNQRMLLKELFHSVHLVSGQSIIQFFPVLISLDTFIHLPLPYLHTLSNRLLWNDTASAQAAPLPSPDGLYVLVGAARALELTPETDPQTWNDCPFEVSEALKAAMDAISQEPDVTIAQSNIEIVRQGSDDLLNHICDHLVKILDDDKIVISGIPQKFDLLHGSLVSFKLSVGVTLQLSAYVGPDVPFSKLVVQNTGKKTATTLIFVLMDRDSGRVLGPIELNNDRSLFSSDQVCINWFKRFFETRGATFM